MSVCVSVSPICATNQELYLISNLVLCLHMKITTCLIDSSFSCELVRSFSAYESILVYLEQSFHSYMIPMVPWHMQLTWRSVRPKQCMVQLIQHGTTTLNAFNSFLAIHKNFLSKCYQLFIGHKITFSKF